MKIYIVVLVLLFKALYSSAQYEVYKFGNDRFIHTTGGTWNTFIGLRAGTSVGSSSVNNTFFGFESGADNTGGSSNTFMGASSGRFHTTGSNNVKIGLAAGYNNNGNFNVILGTNAGKGIDGQINIASYNTFIGQESGYFNTAGQFNTFLGYFSGRNNSLGNYNTFLGKGSGEFNTGGNDNTYLGFDAGWQSKGNGNTMIGKGTGSWATTGNYNTFIGHLAGASSEANKNTASENTFVGYGSGLSNTIGGSNTFLGAGSGYFNTSGSDNAFFGKGTGNANTLGDANTFIGTYSGSFNQTGKWNTYLGQQAGYKNVSGQGNTALGFQAGNQNTGSNNTLVGMHSGYNTTGSDNVFLGYQAGFTNTTGLSNLYLGNNANGFGTNAAILQRSGAIGYNARVSINDAIVLGDFQNANLKIGIGTTAPQNRLDITSPSPNTSGVRLSSLTSSSNPLISNGKVLSVNASGDIILVPDVSGAGGSNTHSDTIWTRNGANTKFGGGNLGIGTINPQNRLDISSLSPNTSGVRLSSLTSSSGTSASNGKVLSVNPSGDIILVPDVAGAGSNTHSDSVWTRNGANTKFGGGNLGIGTINPQNRLDISSLSPNTSGVRLSSLTSSSNPLISNGKVLSVNASGDIILVPDVSGTASANTHSDSVWTRNGANTRFGGGNLGVGTLNPQNRLDITSPSPNTSGVRLRSLTSNSPTVATNTKVLSVNASGDIILVPDVSGTASANTHSDSVWTRNGANTRFGGGNLGVGTLNPQNRLDITSPSPNTSGVRLSSLTSNSPTVATNTKVLSVNASGDIILVPDVSGTASANTHSDSVWVRAARNTNYTGGNIGIGVSSPQYKLDVNGDINIPYGSNLKINGANFIKTSANFNTLIGYLAGNSLTSPAAIGNTFLGANAGKVHSTGLYNVGVGMDAGASNSAGSNNVFLGVSTGGLNVNGNGNIFIGAGANTIGSNAANLQNSAAIGAGAQVSINYAIVLGDFRDDKIKVGIGVHDPQHRLDVKGVINMRAAFNSPSLKINGRDFLGLDEQGEFIVSNFKMKYRSTSQWADRVFEKEYALMPLSELGSYVQKNKHLPGIPSAREVVAQGVSTQEMLPKLLEKIEEQTLYTQQIYQENQILKAENQRIKDDVSSLRAEMEALKKMIREK